MWTPSRSHLFQLFELFGARDRKLEVWGHPRSQLFELFELFEKIKYFKVYVYFELRWAAAKITPASNNNHTKQFVNVV